jgi:hypothetical protein
MISTLKTSKINGRRASQAQIRVKKTSGRVKLQKLG